MHNRRFFFFPLYRLIDYGMFAIAMSDWYTTLPCFMELPPLRAGRSSHMEQGFYLDYMTTRKEIALEAFRKRCKSVTDATWNRLSATTFGPNDKAKARAYLRLAVIRGLISKQPCAICKYSKAHAHHIDYTKPLSVVWLCRSCHGKEHVLIESGNNRITSPTQIMPANNHRNEQYNPVSHKEAGRLGGSVRSPAKKAAARANAARYWADVKAGKRPKPNHKKGVEK